MGNGMQVDAVGVIHAMPNNKLSLPNGLHIEYPSLYVRNTEGKQEWSYLSKGHPVKIYGGKIVENFTQAVARCVVAEQMLKISKRYKVVLTVHDAVACVAPIEEAEEAKKFVVECMSWQPAWATGLPLACEAGMGASYGDC
jgi:DNA polymerase